MGASQSSGQHAANSGQPVKTSYYELLGIQRQATEDEIKKAYRRRALELHPDRNYGNEEAATKTFSDIQAAYEVLSDPQERAWYDSHESAILRGDDVSEGDAPTFENVRVTTADDLARMVSKFNRNVDFSDAPSGFFGFLRETFDQLAKEEEIAAGWENVDVREYPTFGHKDDGYDDVVKSFYVAWSSFATVKSFSWKDQYRLSEASDRFIRRRMEQENTKLRQESKREFNEAVRSLIAFVRKRDPRYVPSTQSEAERQRVLRDASAAQAARARAANEAKLTGSVPDWTKARDPEELEESEEEEVEEEVLECVACNKVFKSENQWAAHERSKKHQKAVRSLQQKMRKDNANLDLDADASGTSTPVEDDVNDEIGNSEADARSGHESGVMKSEAQLDEANPSDEEDASKASADHENADARENGSVKDEPIPANGDGDYEEHATSDDDEDYAPIEAIQTRMNSVTLDSTPTTLSDDDSAAPPAKQKKGKAAQKRAKKAAAAEAVEQSGAAFKCQSCNAGFPDKKHLFDHLKEQPSHATLKPGGGRGKKGKRK